MSQQIEFQEPQDSDSQVIDEAMRCYLSGSHTCIYKPRGARAELWHLTRYRHDYGKSIEQPKRPDAIKLAALKFMMNKSPEQQKRTNRPAFGSAR